MFKFLKRKTILAQLQRELIETTFALLQNEHDAETIKGRKVKYTARKARLEATLAAMGGAVVEPAPQVPCGCDASEADECPDNAAAIRADLARRYGVELES